MEVHDGRVVVVGRNGAHIAVMSRQALDYAQQVQMARLFAAAPRLLHATELALELLQDIADDADLHTLRTALLAVKGFSSCD